MSPRPALERLNKRPVPSAWKSDELVSLAEAVALYFPDGPMTANALRIAHRRGELAAVEICSRLYTTPAAIEAMTQLRCGEASRAEPVRQMAPAGSVARIPPGLTRRAAAARKRRLG